MELRARQETPRVSSRLFLRSLLEVRHYSNDTLVSLPSRSLPPFPLIAPFSWAAPDGAPPFLSGRLGCFTSARVTRNGLEEIAELATNSELSLENDQIIGSYLEIEDVTLEDYGEYKCEVSNGVDEEITLAAHVYRQEPQFVLSLPNGSWRKSLLLAVLVLVLLLSAGAFYARCWLPLALFCRDKFGRLEESDGKECDALVCYHEKDSSLVIGIVIPTLESRHRYKCAALELSQLNHNCKYSRPLLALISGDDDPCFSSDNYVVAATATVYPRNTRVPLQKALQSLELFLNFSLNDTHGMRTLLKTKNGETRSKEREKRGRKSKTGTSCARWGSLRVYFAVHPATMQPTCREYKQSSIFSTVSDLIPILIELRAFAHIQYKPVCAHTHIPRLSVSFGVNEVSLETTGRNAGIYSVDQFLLSSHSPVHQGRIYTVARGSLEISPHANTTRRIVVVLSPASLDNIWTDASVGAVLKQLSSLPIRVIVVTLKRLPSTTATIAKRSRRDRRDADNTSFDRLTILSWQDGGGGGSDGNGTAFGSGGRKFWYKLRLAMPAMRPVASETGCQSVAMIVQANGKCGQQKARSRESLEVLV
ncbi:hypothetical protein ALC62_03540 [Cyphomyrmex costatus]|uniref:Ig-like domain-containing protein n=1 Tax=Cyphomyrmex costatus TaxID=456900 RepID=A0A151ILD9_9HYME|nr:hypothetical protein ALC62_03540 [Cyphomyrmex costatus]